MPSAELQLSPKCPDCGRLTVDNDQHCGEKSPELWAKACQWMKCKGRLPDGSRCGRVYSSDNWPGFRGN